jgi:hypothetical protein
VHHDKLKPYVGENRPTCFTGSTSLSQSTWIYHWKFYWGMTEVTFEFDIIVKGVDLLKLNHNVHVLYIVRYLLLYIICKG